MELQTEYMPNPAIAAAAFGLLLVLWFRKKNDSNLPPGPWGLPILGHLPFLGENPHEYYAKQGEKYGHIFTIKMGMNPVVVIHSMEGMKELLVNKGMAFAARPPIPWKKYTGSKGIMVNDPPEVITLRRWTISMFRDFGMGKKSLEGSINTEIGHLVARMKEYQNQNINLKDTIYSSVANVTHKVLFGFRINLEDPLLLELTNNVELVLNQSGANNIGQYLPFLKYLPITIDDSEDNLQQGMEALNRYSLQQIQKHKESFKPGNINDFTDAYLQQMSKETNDSVFTEDNLKQTLTDMSLGGFDTTTSTLMWGILFMIHYPDVQRRCKQEIREQIGKDDQPVMLDKMKLPYVEATILEMHRVGNIIPTPLRVCIETVEVFGYVIPAGTWIVPNFGSRVNDLSVWADPQKFDPTRFLDENGELAKNEKLLTFGLGKRDCVGKTLAKQELFLYMTTLLQKFTFLPPEGIPMPELKRSPPAFVVPPLPYKVRFTVD